MTTKNHLRKGIALVLTATLAVGLAPSFLGIGITAHAESNDVPSIEAYATKEQLRTDFKPNDEGSQAIGMIKFGKNGTNAINWYILGEDDGVKKSSNNDNTAIFAANKITNKKFLNVSDCTLESTKPKYAADKGITYIGTSPADDTPMYWNHYGLSSLRSYLQDIADNTSYFSTAEQGLMQATTVANYDNTKVLDAEYGVYTISDKLYTPSSKDRYTYSTGGIVVSDIYIGTSVIAEDNTEGLDIGGSIKLTVSKYCSPDDSTIFWLRSQFLRYGANYTVQMAYPQGVGYYGAVTEAEGVRPASNLNLADVLFASAVEAPSSATSGKSGTITTSGTSQAAMLLRMDGSDETTVSDAQKLGGTIGKVELADDAVVITKGTTTKRVNLVIQGKTDDSDWYYLVTVSGDTTIEKSQISGHSDADLSKCSIWLEATGADGLLYAVEPHKHVWEEVESDEYKVPDAEPTYTDGGNACIKHTSYYKSCKCGEKSDETFVADDDFPHDYAWSGSDTEHWKQCNNCDHIDEATKAEHEFDLETEKCECGYDLNLDGGHNPQPVDKKEATCTSAGYESYYKCVIEGHSDIYKVSIGVLISIDSKEEIPATGHKASAYQYDESKHWKICENKNDDKVCGVEFAEGTHTFNGNKCTVCGYTKAGSDDSSSRNSERYSGSGSGSSGGGGGSSASSSTGTSIIGATGTSGTWVKDNTGWRYEYTGGTYATGSNMNNAEGKAIEKIAWIKINNADYAFGSDAYLKSGWVLDNTDGKWYYCDVNRGKLYGWYYDMTDGYWYYLDANTGAMLTGWQLIGGRQYYFAPAPDAATYAFDASSSRWVYSNAANYRPYGSMYAGTTTPDNHRVDESGARVE